MAGLEELCWKDLKQVVALEAAQGNLEDQEAGAAGDPAAPGTLADRDPAAVANGLVAEVPGLAVARADQVARDSAVVHVRCIRPSAQSASRNVKFHSSPQKAGQSTARIASGTKETIEQLFFFCFLSPRGWPEKSLLQQGV